MIILNESCKVDVAIAAQFIDFVQQQYIPKMLESGCFDNGRLCRIIDPSFAEEEGITMVIQFFADTEEAYLRYKQEYKNVLGSMIGLAFGQKAASFQTAMQLVS